MTHAYHPLFCEENIWQLAGDPKFFESSQAFVVLISNPDQRCPLWHQRAAAAPGEPVVWDYHVVLFDLSGEAVVWDLDTSLPGPPTPWEVWWEQTFPLRYTLPESLNPLFRVFLAKEYREVFSSDRSHMRDARGQWLAPPPPWPAIQPPEGYALLDLLCMRETKMPGILHDHESMEAWVGEQA